MLERCPDLILEDLYRKLDNANTAQLCLTSKSLYAKYLAHLDRTARIVLDETTTMSYLKIVSHARKVKQIVVKSGCGISNIDILEKFIGQLGTLIVDYPIYISGIDRAYSHTLRTLSLTFYPGPIDLTMLTGLENVTLKPVYDFSTNRCILPRNVSFAHLEMYDVGSIRFEKNPSDLSLTLRYVSLTCEDLITKLKFVKDISLSLYKIKGTRYPEIVYCVYSNEPCRPQHIRTILANFRANQKSIV